MNRDERLKKEIEGNLEFFLGQQAELAKQNGGRYALLRHREIVGIYDTLRDAKTTGESFFEDGLYSIQKIQEKPIDLGYFSHAVHLGTAQ